MIEPGLLECSSQVLYNVVPAGAQGNVSAVPLYRPCGHRFRVGVSPSGGQCACGMFASATCQECGRPLCFRHIDEYAGRVMCGQDAARARNASAAREAARLEKARAETMGEIHAWEGKAAAALRALPDRMERDVRILAADLPRIFTTELGSLVPADWDQDELVRWFLRSVQEPPTKIGVYVPSIWSKVGKYKELPGWILAKASTVMKSMAHGEYGDGHIYVLQDGRVWYQNSWTPEPGERIGLRGVKTMAELARLTPLLTEPRPGHWEDPFKHPETGRFHTFVYRV